MLGGYIRKRSLLQEALFRLSFFLILLCIRFGFGCRPLPGKQPSKKGRSAFAFLLGFLTVFSFLESLLVLFPIILWGFINFRVRLVLRLRFRIGILSPGSSSYSGSSSSS